MLLADGYRAITLSATAAGEGADAWLDEVVGQLQQEGSEEAGFFAEQLRTAERILRERLGRSAG